MKEYYKILHLSPDATEEEVRKAYRRLALRHHPDRNQGDAAAEERFKEIAEAYGVLMDPVKRAGYDRLRVGASGHQGAGGFSYSQEEILRDLFRDPRLNQSFHDLLREFQQTGFRFDQQFFQQTFFGGGQGAFRGVFVWGAFRRQPFGKNAEPKPRQKLNRNPQAGRFSRQPGLLRRLASNIENILQGWRQALALPSGVDPALDLDFNLPVSPAAAREGRWVQIAVPRDFEKETLRVRIPPATPDGSRLRLKGKGRRQDALAGDLYLTIHYT
jgi:curved DNA-binding protein